MLACVAKRIFGCLPPLTGGGVAVSQPPAEVCLTDLAWDYPGV